MTATQTPPAAGGRPVRLGRRSSRGVLLGFSRAQLSAAAAALVVFILGISLAGGAGAAATSPVWVVLLAAAAVPVAGRPVIEWAPVAAHWALRRALRQTIYRVRPSRPRPAGTLALPGDAAALRVHVDAETGAAMVHDPHAGTLTVVLRVRHPAFVLLGHAEQDRRVTGWGRVLAAACQSGRIARLQLLERSEPDSGTAVHGYWDRHGHADGSWAARAYAELVATAAPAAERHTTTLSLCLDMRRAGRAIRHAGGGLRGAAAVLRQEMATMLTALRSADLGPDGWLAPADLAAMLRTAYDPAAADILAQHPVGRDLATAGPVAVDEQWDQLRTDTAHHAVLWISQWPRSEVHPTFLAPLLLTSGTRRSLSIVYRPIPPGEAMRDVRRERVEHTSDAVQRERIGQLTSAVSEAEYDDVRQRERELVAGHGELAYAGFIAVTATTRDELDAARATIEQAAVQAGCETRLLVGQQAQAFVAAALPLGRGL